MDAEWANVIVTGMALFAAGWAALSTHRALEIERSRDEKRDQADRSAQASLVAAWAERGHRDWRFTLVNTSHVPVYDVTVKFHSTERPGEHPKAHIDVLAPGTVEVPYPAVWTWPTGEQDPYSGEVPSSHAVDEISVSVTFTDAAGISWERGPNGRLTENAR